tara:strand:- start:3532 stop:4155 length:624 start_codon:yes stop_codon:yes gene_type:complete
MAELTVNQLPQSEKKIFKNINKLNLLNNFTLNYKFPTDIDVKNVLDIMNEYSNNDKIFIASHYDNILDKFMSKYFNWKEFNSIEYDKILLDLEYINNIINYFVFKYKIFYNSPRPFQIANTYDIELYPVNLLSANTPSFPSGHSAIYYAYYLYFKTIDKNNNYEDILYNGRISRIIGGLHFLQDDEFSIKLVNEIFKRDQNLKIYKY